MLAAFLRAAPLASGGSERSPDELGPYLATFAPNHFVAGLFASEAQDKFIGYVKIM
jgi:hypothetical protein